MSLTLDKTAVIITACVFYTPEKGEIVEALLEHPTFVMPDSIVRVNNWEITA